MAGLKGPQFPARIGLAAFDFESGTLILTEAESKRRASLYAVEGKRALAASRSRWTGGPRVALGSLF